MMVVVYNENQLNIGFMKTGSSACCGFHCGTLPVGTAKRPLAMSLVPRRTINHPELVSRVGAMIEMERSKVCGSQAASAQAGKQLDHKAPPHL